MSLFSRMIKRRLYKASCGRVSNELNAPVTNNDTEMNASLNNNAAAHAVTYYTRQMNGSVSVCPLLRIC